MRELWFVWFSDIAFRPLLLARFESTTIYIYIMRHRCGSCTKCVWWVCQALRLSCCFTWLSNNFFYHCFKRFPLVLFWGTIVLIWLYWLCFIVNASLLCFFSEWWIILHKSCVFCRDYLGEIFYYSLFCSSTFWLNIPT